MKTYDRDTYVRANRLWDEGVFGWRWANVRRIAASRGFIFPPNGTPHDDRDADPPSQRAIVYRALMDNPTRLDAIVRRSASWGEVVDGVIGLEKRLAESADEIERDEAWERKNEATPLQSVQAIGDVFERVAESLGYVKSDV